MSRRVIPKALFLYLLAFMIGCSAGKPSQNDLRFVSEMIPHHHLGLQIIEIGEYRSSDVRLRRMIFEMSSYHHKEIHVLESLADDWNVQNAQTFPGSIKQSQLDVLRKLEGNAHDIAWLQVMIQHHEGALVISHRALIGAKDREIRQIAEDTIATQSDEIAKMRLLLRDFCKQESHC